MRKWIASNPPAAALANKLEASIIYIVSGWIVQSSLLTSVRSEEYRCNDSISETGYNRPPTMFISTILISTIFVSLINALRINALRIDAQEINA
jgi:hypothetical protein